MRRLIEKMKSGEKLTKQCFKIGVISLMTLILSSCAYYNTFYNAKKYFESAQAKPLNVKGKASSAAIEEYNKVIKKCGIILTDYKDSKWADDAVFLLAKALYFRGNNELQSQEKFQDILTFYPDSPFVPESKLFLAQIAFDLNKKTECYKMLQEFIQNPAFKDDHPKALVLISDYYIKEKNYIDAQFYLRLIIDKYSDSKEYPNAFFLLGKTLYDNEDYSASLKVFTELNSSKIDRRIKLDALYYMAYNHYNLKKYTLSEKEIKRLNKQEYREDKLPLISLLNGRNNAETQDVESGIKILEKVMIKYPRSLFSSEAAFHIAELYFSRNHDYEKAIEFYNKVKSEFPSSPYYQKSVTRSAIASQIIQIQKTNRDLSLDDLINEQFKLAEYYLYELDLPDSAIYIYDKIPSQKDRLTTLLAELQPKRLMLDSLFTIKADSCAFDTLLTKFNTEYSDSLKPNIAYADSSRRMLADSLQNAYSQRFKQMESDIIQYDIHFIPSSIFTKMVIQDIIKKNDAEVMRLISQLNNDYPDNRYTIAANDYLNKREVNFMTAEEKNIMFKYDSAMNIIADSVDTALDMLKDIASSDFEEFALKANFTIAYTYYFELKDSLSSKPYFNQVLLKAPQSDYAAFTKSFYDGLNMKLIDVLPAILDLERYEKEKQAELLRAAQTDSLIADSTKTDSLLIKTEIPNDEDKIDKKNKAKNFKPKKPKSNSLFNSYLKKPEDYFFILDTYKSLA